MVLRLGCARGTLGQEKVESLLYALDAALSDIVTNPRWASTRLPAALDALPPVLPAYEGTSTAGSSTVVDDASPEDEYTPDEAALREVVAAVAKVPIERLRLRTPFYAIGIDSISALQVVSRARRTGLALAISDILSGMHLQGACRTRDDRLAERETSEVEKEVLPEIHDRVLAHLRRNKHEVESVLPALPVCINVRGSVQNAVLTML